MGIKSPLNFRAKNTTNWIFEVNFQKKMRHEKKSGKPKKCLISISRKNSEFVQN